MMILVMIKTNGFIDVSKADDDKGPDILIPSISIRI